MADTAKRFCGPLSLGSSAATRYTVPASTTAILRNIHVTNTTANAVGFTASIGADAAGTRLFDTEIVPAHGSLDWSGLMVMAAGEILQAYGATTSALTLTVSGVEVT